MRATTKALPALEFNDMRLRTFALATVFAVALHAQSGPAAQSPAAPPIALPANLPVLPAAQQARMDRDLLEIDITHLQALYAGHKYTVEQVTRWYMGRIARYNGIYRAVQTVDTEGALATAKREDAEAKLAHGPLWGVPIVIKANTAVKGLPDTDGWQGFALSGHEFIASKDATVVAHLRAAGAIILGITNMPDFAASDTNRSTAFGRTGNAYDVRFSPGGSSGGTVTAVTSNFAMLGTGTDTANSIRMPAGTSSVVGVLPTRGLTSIAGIAPAGLAAGQYGAHRTQRHRRRHRTGSDDRTTRKSIERSAGLSHRRCRHQSAASARTRNI